MTHRWLESLGRSVPQIALGTVELGVPYGMGLGGNLIQPTYLEAERVVHKALDLGIRFIDTARAYGTSEEVLGRCLAGRRSEVVLATKITPLSFEACSDAELIATLNNSLEHSLRLLRTDCVDWLMLHSATLNNVQNIQRLLAPLGTLRQQGKFRAFGASIYDDALRSSIGEPSFRCLQVAANAIDRRAESALAATLPRPKDFIIRSVLLRGALTSAYRKLPDTMKPLRDAIAMLEKIALAAGMSLTELAYRYAAGLQGVMLVGTASVPELEEALRFVERGSLSEDVLNSIHSLPALDDILLNPGRWPKFES